MTDYPPRIFDLPFKPDFSITNLSTVQTIIAPSITKLFNCNAETDLILNAYGRCILFSWLALLLRIEQIDTSSASLVLNNFEQFVSISGNSMISKDIVPEVFAGLNLAYSHRNLFIIVSGIKASQECLYCLADGKANKAVRSVRGRIQLKPETVISNASGLEELTDSDFQPVDFKLIEESFKALQGSMLLNTANQELSAGLYCVAYEQLTLPINEWVYNYYTKKR